MVVLSQHAKPRLAIVVSCTDRKSRLPAAHLRMRSVKEQKPADRCSAWITRLEQEFAPELPAKDLYAGGAWHVAMTLPAIADSAGCDADLWIASAGYGLIQDATLLKPYSATFAHHEDSVSRGSDRASKNRDWWERLSKWAGPGDGPRCIEQLVTQDPSRITLVVASGHYIDAMRDDLLATIERASSPERLHLISAARNIRGKLADYLIPSSAHLESFLGGARLSLNLRVARWLIEHWKDHGFDRGAMRRQLADLVSAQAGVRKFDRTPVPDPPVRTWIAERRIHDPSATRSKLLRLFRDSGMACEQSRFARLFQEVVDGERP